MFSENCAIRIQQSLTTQMSIYNIKSVFLNWSFVKEQQDTFGNSNIIGKTIMKTVPNS